MYSLQLDSFAVMARSMNVVVTGFSVSTHLYADNTCLETNSSGRQQTWGPDKPINSSELVARAMGQSIVRSDLPRINVLPYSRSIRTSWEDVQQVIPTIWQGLKSDYPDHDFGDESDAGTFPIDFLIHIGMRRETEHSSYLFETRASGDCYEREDVDGKTPPPDSVNRWADSPNELHNAFNVPAALEEITKEMPVRSLNGSSHFVRVWFAQRGLFANLFLPGR